MIKSRILTKLMGCDFELIVVAPNKKAAASLLWEGVAEITRIERLLTTFSPDSQTSLINRHAAKEPIPVDTELYGLIQRSLHLSAITQGAFDISAGALSRLFRFKERVPRLPEKDQLTAALGCTGYRHIRLLPGNRIRLALPGMRISFNAIGKGYAADRVRSLWQAKGVTSGVINASGDLTAWGQQPDGRPWKIGIADPDNPAKPLFCLGVAQTSVATSGNYEQYFEIDGTRYSHNIDPRSGMPVSHTKSVTIISPSAELSDALATAVTVMGHGSGLHLIDQLPETHAIVIDASHRVFTSKNIKLHEQNTLSA